MHRRHLLGLAALAVAAPLTACRGDEPTSAPTPSGTAPAGMVLLTAGENRSQTPREPRAQDATPGPAACAFAARLAQALAGTEDLLVSPVSLALPLAMLANGAKAATLTDLLSLLGFRSLDEQNRQLGALQQEIASRGRTIEGRRGGVVALEVANALWAQQATPVRTSFLDATARWYEAGVHGVDFGDPAATVGAINGWAAEHTQDRIKDLLTPETITPDTRLVLTNAIWFKAPWADEFSRGDALPFTGDDGSTSAVDSFRAVGGKWADGPGWRAAALDYLGHDLAMAFVLPDKGKEDSLLASWASGGLHTLLTGWREATVKMTVPVWQHEQEIGLKKPLRKMGVGHLFADDPDVDLTGIRDEEMGVTAAVQKTWIAVDEKGSEAAAATAVVVGATAAQPPQESHELVLDRPF